MTRSGKSLTGSHSEAAGDVPLLRDGKPESPRAIDLLAPGILVAIIAAYLGLTPLGQWQPDEYDYFGQLARSGWNAVWTRLSWSPRPFSEALYGLYGFSANHSHQPLTGLFLSLCWLGLLASAFWTAMIARRERKTSTISDYLLGLALVAAFLTSGPLFQVFYWPAGAAAYLPTLAATALLFLQVLYGYLSDHKGRLRCSVCLLIAALSSEMGAIFVLCFCGLNLAQSVTARIARTAGSLSDEVPRWLRGLPLAISGAVLVWAAAYRLPAIENAFTTLSPSLHNPVLSVTAAIRTLGLEILGFDAGTHRVLSALLKLTSRLALAVGFALVWLRSRSFGKDKRIREQLVFLCCSFIAASFLSLFATFVHFGNAGGERYETLRRCWILMTLSGAAILGFSAARTDHSTRRLAIGKFATALLLIGVLMPWHITPLVRQYAVYGDVLRSIKYSFQSGWQEGSRQMMFVLPPNHGVITPAVLAPGTYMRKAGAGDYDYARYILEYFGKDVLVVRSRPDAAGFGR